MIAHPGQVWRRHPTGQIVRRRLLRHGFFRDKRDHCHQALGWLRRLIIAKKLPLQGKSLKRIPGRALLYGACAEAGPEMPAQQKERTLSKAILTPEASV